MYSQQGDTRSIVFTCRAEGSGAGSFPRGGQEEGAGQVPRQEVPGGEELDSDPEREVLGGWNPGPGSC